MQGLPPLSLYAGYWIGAFFCFKIIGAALLVFSSLFIIWRLRIRFDFHDLWNNIRYFLTQGYPIAFSMLLFLLSTRIDQVLLSDLLSFEAVGIYAISTKILLLSIEGIWGPIANIVFPILSRSEKESVNTLIAKAIKYVVAVFILFGLLALFFTWWGREIIVFVLGEEYEPSYFSLRIVIWASIFISLTALCYRILIILGNQVWYIVVQLCALALTIALNLYLIPKFGYLGAAYALVISQGTAFVLVAFITIHAIQLRALEVEH